MATFTKQKLSADPSGSGMLLDSGGMPSIVHVTGTSLTTLDEVWLYAINNSFTESGTVQCSWNGTTTFFKIPELSGMFLLIPGFVLSGDGSVGAQISAADMSGNVDDNISLFGYVNRITP
jgi:hypothetical protein